MKVLKVKNQYQAIAEKLEGLKLPKKITRNFILILGPLPTKSINVVIDLEGNRAGYTTDDTGNLGSTPQNNSAVGDKARRKSDIGKALMSTLKLPKAEVKVFERPGKSTSHFAPLSCTGQVQELHLGVLSTTIWEFPKQIDGQMGCPDMQEDAEQVTLLAYLQFLIFYCKNTASRHTFP